MSSPTTTARPTYLARRDDPAPGCVYLKLADAIDGPSGSPCVLVQRIGPTVGSIEVWTTADCSARFADLPPALARAWLEGVEAMIEPHLPMSQFDLLTPFSVRQLLEMTSGSHEVFTRDGAVIGLASYARGEDHTPFTMTLEVNPEGAAMTVSELIAALSAYPDAVLHECHLLASSARARGGVVAVQPTGSAVMLRTQAL